MGLYDSLSPSEKSFAVGEGFEELLGLFKKKFSPSYFPLYQPVTLRNSGISQTSLLNQSDIFHTLFITIFLRIPLVCSMCNKHIYFCEFSNQDLLSSELTRCTGSVWDGNKIPHSSPFSVVLCTSCQNSFDRAPMCWLMLSCAGTASRLSLQYIPLPQRPGTPTGDQLT